MKYSFAKKYVEESLKLLKLENALSDALVNINEDNYVVGLVPEGYQALVESLMIEVVGENLFDWLMYWVYETDQKKAEFSIDDIEYVATSFDELWSIIVKYDN
jgi:hypothetical protein